MTNYASSSRHEAGLSAIEILIAIAVLSIGLLGFIGTLSSAQFLTRGTKELNAANLAIISAVEVFREECRTDFEGTLAKYQNGMVAAAPAGIGSGATIEQTVILDETQITSPPIDINGNGTHVETVTDLSTVRIAVLRIRLSWTSASGPRSLEHVALVARGDL